MNGRRCPSCGSAMNRLEGAGGWPVALTPVAVPGSGAGYVIGGWTVEAREPRVVWACSACEVVQ